MGAMVEDEGDDVQQGKRISRTKTVDDGGAFLGIRQVRVMRILSTTRPDCPHLSFNKFREPRQILSGHQVSLCPAVG